MSLDIGLYVEVDTGGTSLRAIHLYDANYTGNVYPMWEKAGVYEVLYESGGVEASAIIPILEDGIADMELQIDAYSALNPPNGWGNYEGALSFLHSLLAACKRDPRALISSCGEMDRENSQREVAKWKR